MQSFFKFPDPGPETEAQKERAAYLALALKRARHERRQRWKGGLRKLTSAFRK